MSPWNLTDKEIDAANNYIAEVLGENPPILTDPQDDRTHEALDRAFIFGEMWQYVLTSDAVAGDEESLRMATLAEYFITRTYESLGRLFVNKNDMGRIIHGHDTESRVDGYIIVPDSLREDHAGE